MTAMALTFRCWSCPDALVAPVPWTEQRSEEARSWT